MSDGKQEKPPERMSITMDAIARQTLIDALESYSRSLFTGDPAGRIRAARADHLRDTLKDVEEIVIAEIADLASAGDGERVRELEAALRAAVPEREEAWLIPDTDGDTGPDECFFCGKDENQRDIEPPFDDFEHSPTCPGRVARKLLEPKGTKA